MRHQFRKCHHVQIIETASILHISVMGVLDRLDNDERVHVAAAANTASSQLSHSPLSWPTKATS